MRALVFLLLPAFLAGSLFALVGCGRSSPGDRATEGGRDEAPVSPAVVSADEVLAVLAHRVADGKGISDDTWAGDVQAVALACWPDLRSTAQAIARRDHANLATIAGDMTVQLLVGGPGARAAWKTRDPTSIEIHDAFVEAAGAGSDAYRAWVEGEGRRLLVKRVEAITK
ncbi:MAG: hypothetical protein ACC662_03095 [Planctomycetota bacterium]